MTNTWANTTNSTFELTGVQLEVGDVATDFEHLLSGVELARCQRYFQVFAKKGANPEQIGPGYGYATNQVEMQIQFNPPMRTAPSVDIGSGTDYFIFQSSGDNNNIDELVAYRFTERNGLLYKGGLSGVTAGKAYRVENNNASAYLHFNAEL